MEREKLRVRFPDKEKYEEFFSSAELNALFNEMIVDKLALSQITALLAEGPRSTGEIAEFLGLSASQVSKHLIESSRYRLVKFDEDLKQYALA